MKSKNFSLKTYALGVLVGTLILFCSIWLTNGNGFAFFSKPVLILASLGLAFAFSLIFAPLILHAISNFRNNRFSWGRTTLEVIVVFAIFVLIDFAWYKMFGGKPVGPHAIVKDIIWAIILTICL